MDDLISRQAAIAKDTNVPSKDCISRQAAVEEIARRDTTDGNVKVFSGQEIISILHSMPQAVPRMRGRWLESNLVPSRKGKPDGRLFICSECNKGWVKQDRSMKGINYCPNCGSYNGGEQDETD